MTALVVVPEALARALVLNLGFWLGQLEKRVARTQDAHDLVEAELAGLRLGKYFLFGI